MLLVNMLVIIVSLALAFFFVAAEFALVQTRISSLDELEQNETNSKHLKKYKLIRHMVTRLNEYLSTTQVGTSICGIILGWIGEATLATLIEDIFGKISWISSTTLHIIGAILGVLVLTYLEVVLTEIVPKNISIGIPVKVLMWTSTPLKYFHSAFYPFVWLLNSSANGIVKLFGMTPASENSDTFSQAEILTLSKNAVSGGELDKHDYIYMQRAFDFNDKVAKDVMIDRTQLVVLNVESSTEDALKEYLMNRFSRLPVVANNDKDKILGYVYNYDIIKQSQSNINMPISKLMRNIITVPENLPLQQVLEQMIQKQIPISVVVDEYGGTSGIITDKDIYEEVFGTINDEIDNISSDNIHKQGNGYYMVSGKTTVYDFERYFEIDVPNFEQEDAVTLGGYVIDNNPKVKVHDHLRLEDYDLEILDNDNAHIDWFLVHKVSSDKINTIKPIVDDNK